MLPELIQIVESFCILHLLGFVCTNVYFSIKNNFINFIVNVCANDPFNSLVTCTQWPSAYLIEAVINGQCDCALTRFINI